MSLQPLWLAFLSHGLNTGKSGASSHHISSLLLLVNNQQVSDSWKNSFGELYHKIWLGMYAGKRQSASYPAQACVYWFFDLSSLKFEWNNKNIYKSVQRVFCRKPKAFHVCTLGTFIQELFYLPFKKNHPKIFQMKTSKTLKSHMKNWCQCDFPRNPLLFTVWSPVQCFLPIWQLSLKQMATSWEGSLCVSPPGLTGLQAGQISLHKLADHLLCWFVTTQKPPGGSSWWIWGVLRWQFSDVMASSYMTE